MRTLIADYLWILGGFVLAGAAFYGLLVGSLWLVATVTVWVVT